MKKRSIISIGGKTHWKPQKITETNQSEDEYWKQLYPPFVTQGERTIDDKIAWILQLVEIFLVIYQIKMTRK